MVHPHEFTPIRQAPAYLKVCEAIEADILSGALAEGQILPTEASLCEQFGVTRSTVREGIRLLETSGLVTRGAGKRLVVCRPRLDDVALSTSRALTFSGVTFREGWEALSLFQPSVAETAAQQFSAEQLTRLREIYAALKATDREDHNGVVTCTDAFFGVFAEGFDNRVTAALLRSLNMLIDAGLRQVIANVPDARARILDAQKHLIEAVATKDSEKAKRWMKRHIDDLQRGYSLAGIDMNETIT